MSSPPRISVLFVCMGNICRSPLAECVFRHKVNLRGVADRFEIDSAGTGGWHAGHPPDARMQRVGRANGIDIQGSARQVRRNDLSRFSHLICMDRDNLENLLAIGAPRERIRLLLEFDPAGERREVPDPYYGDDDGFDLVFRLVDRACDGLIDALLADVKNEPS